MRFTFYYDENNKKRFALFFDDGIVTIPNDFLGHEISPDDTADTVLGLSDEEFDKLSCLYREIESGSVRADKIGARLAPLVLNERANVFCVGRNYRTVLDDMNRATSKDLPSLSVPAFFYKPNRAIVASGDKILLCRTDSSMLDYEGEIGVVIGKKGKDLSPEEAADYIYGFTICNDVSARDVMKEYYQMYKGKSMDSFAPIGPCIITADEVPDYRHMDLETHINAELRQKGNSSDMIFDFPTVISFLSRAMTLMPGDIIMTGTPAGIGAAMCPPHFLKDGDLVEISVSGIGTLCNTVCEYLR